MSHLRAAFTLKQLEAFYAAATLPSFSVAAAQLHLSQSSLSKRISELEAHVGETMFDRAGHRASLTAAGTALLPLARELIEHANAIPDAVGRAPPLRGVCRFGTGELAAITWLPQLMARCRREFPALAMAPHVDLGQELENRLVSGELDFAVVAGWSAHPEIASQTIGEVHYGWAGAPALVGKATGVCAQMLKDTPVITMPAGAGSTRIFEAWAMANNFVIPQRIVCNNMVAIAGMVSAGVGIGYFPAGWLQAMAARGSVRLLDSDPPLQPLLYSFQWRRSDIRPLIAVMREQVQAVVDFSGVRLPG